MSENGDSGDSSVVRRAVPDASGGASIRPNVAMFKAAPGVARVAAVSAWHVLSWSVNASTSGATYVVRRAMDGEPATSIVQDAVTDLRSAAWRVLGLDEQHGAPGAATPDRTTPRSASASDLQRRGSDLMRRANDVHVVEDTHPAFARILTEITPDEARILRFLYLDGPQPSIDVRTNRPLGIGSELVAGGLNMIAEHAGCVHLDRVEPYLTNLSRLGLIEFSKEQVSNPKRYQVVEAQPKVTDALKRAGRLPKMIQRSINLTVFGAEFCRTCLPISDVRRPGAGAARAERA